MSLLLLYRPRADSGGGGGGGPNVGPTALGGEGGEYFSEEAYRKAVAAVQRRAKPERGVYEEIVEESKEKPTAAPLSVTRKPKVAPVVAKAATKKEEELVAAPAVEAPDFPPESELTRLERLAAQINEERVREARSRELVTNAHFALRKTRAQRLQATARKFAEEERNRQAREAQRREDRDLRDALLVLELLDDED